MQQPLQQSAGTYFMIRESGQSFEDIGLWQSGSATITGRGEPEQVETLFVTDATLPLLGIKPALGRLFTKEDDLPNGPNVVLISHRYWQRAFGGSPSAIGQSLMFNGAAREVVGVLPEDFRFLRADPLVVVPQKINRGTVHAAGFNYQGVARLKPGVSIAQANADVERLLPSLTERFPLPPGFTKKMFDDARFGALVRPLDVDVVGDIGDMLWILLGTVGLVLLVACANVANLFLVRAEARQQELADSHGARRRSAPDRVAADVGIAAHRIDRRRAGHRARVWRYPAAALSAARAAAATQRDRARSDRPALHARYLARRRPAVRRHPDPEVCAAADGVGVERCISGIQRRP